MARHQARTIWKPVWKNMGAINDSVVPVVAYFNSIKQVDADSSQGVQLKHLEVYTTLGVVDASPSNSNIVTGHMGMFKWPSDAATPTLSTIDLDNRSGIFARKLWAVQGTTPRAFVTRVKSARLRLGEELWFFIVKMTEADANNSLTGQSTMFSWETLA